MVPESVVQSSTSLLEYVAQPAARVVVLGCVAGLILCALRVKRVPLRLFAWTTVLYGAMAIALVGWLLPGVQMRVPGAATVERVAEANHVVTNAIATLRAYVSVTKASAVEASGAKVEVKDAQEIQNTKETDSSASTARPTTCDVSWADTGRYGKVAWYRRTPKKEKANSSASTARLSAADKTAEDTRRTSKAASRSHVPQNTKADSSSPQFTPSGILAMTADKNGAGSGAIREADSRGAKSAATKSPEANGRLNADGLTTQNTRRKGPDQDRRGELRGVGSGTRQKANLWVVIAAGIYVAMALLLLGRLLLGMILSHRLARIAEPILDADAVRKLRFRAFASGLESVPRLAESELVSVPATLGVFRPVILLPARWREWDEAKFDAIVAHEVSHVARRDALTHSVSLIHRAIFWFSPLPWWLDGKLNELAEEASDEAALDAGADKQHYAESLLSFFAELAAASGRVWWQGVSMASDGSRAGHAEQRVERILAWRGSASMRKSLGVAVVALAVPVIFLAASVHPFIAHAQDKTQDESKNVIMPGGPKAPALPKAPKGGVVAPAMPSPPQGGVSVPPAPAGPAPGEGVNNPGPMPAAPQGGVSTPPMPPAPNPALAPTGPVSFHPSGEKPLSPIAPGPSIASASIAPGAPVAALPSVAPQSDTSSELRQVEAQVRAAQKQVKQAEAAMPKDEYAIAAAQKALGEAEAQLDQVRLAAQSVQDAKEATEAARKAIREARDQDNSTTITNGTLHMGYGPRYVMMSGNSNEVNMSGDEEDLQHARELKKKISGDFIWFERDEKSYIITDADFIAKAKALFAPEEALEKQEDELGRQQDELGKQQDALSEKMETVKVKIRDITPELEDIHAQLKQLQATGATQEELGRLQSRLGELQSDVGRSQSEAGVSQSEIGRQQGDLGRKQGELGRRQGELGRQEGEIAKKASRELRQMFEDAIAQGIAKPE
jgi:beta-lactamase regulating signal transducer with metallopeptidase domain